MSRFVRTELKKFERYIKELARVNEIIITYSCASSMKVPEFVVLFYFNSYAFMVRCTSRRQFVFVDFLALLHKADKIPKASQSGKSMDYILHLLKLDN